MRGAFAVRRSRAHLVAGRSVLLVDDVLTKGSTTMACANLLQKSFPAATIRIFAMIRTQGLVDDIEKIVDPSIGTIIGHDSGKPYRNP